MNKITIDDCLTIKLRSKIEKLIDLNLDLPSIWDLLKDEIENYEDYMQIEVKRYIKYLTWLQENNKNRDEAFVKYKRYTQNLHQNFKKTVPLTELQQKWKDQKRIDEISALMNFKATSNPTSSLKKASEKGGVPSNLKIEKLKNQEPIIYNFRSIDLYKQEFEEGETPTLKIFENEKEESVQQKTNFVSNPNKPNFTQKNVEELDPIGNQEINQASNFLSRDETTLTNTLQNQLNQENSNAEQNPSLIIENNKDLVFENLMAPNDFDPELSKEPKDWENKNTQQPFMDSEILKTTTNESTFNSLQFLQKMEEKYGFELTSPPTEEESLEKNASFSYQIGQYIKYQGKNYLIKRMELILDFFKHQQIILTLFNEETQEELRINTRKLP